MTNADNPLEPDMVETIKKRLLQTIKARMEGTLNPASAADLRMFDDLLAELLKEESIVLSRGERERLRDDLLGAF